MDVRRRGAGSEAICRKASQRAFIRDSHVKPEGTELTQVRCDASSLKRTKPVEYTLGYIGLEEGNEGKSSWYPSIEHASMALDHTILAYLHLARLETLRLHQESAPLARLVQLMQLTCVSLVASCNERPKLRTYIFRRAFKLLERASSVHRHHKLQDIGHYRLPVFLECRLINYWKRPVSQIARLRFARD